MASLTALRATGFKDPERARHNLQLILEGRPLVPYAAHLDATLARLYPLLLDALWKSPDPDEALNQFERLLAAAGPRAGLVELLANDGDLLLGLVKVCAGGDLLTELLIAQPELLASLANPERLLARKSKPALRQALAAVFVPGTTPIERRDRLRRVKQSEELAVVWRYVLGITTIDAYSREMTALAEATLAAGWLLALDSLVERYGVPRDEAGRFIPSVIVGLGKLGGRELVTGSDLDLFVVFGEDGTTDGAERIDAAWFYSLAVERLASVLGDITAAGVAFPVDLRLRPGSKGSGFASSIASLERYYLEHGDLWERQTLTRTRLILGDRAVARRVRAALRRVVYGDALPRASLKEIAEVRTRMERELGRETPRSPAREIRPRRARRRRVPGAGAPARPRASETRRPTVHDHRGAPRSGARRRARARPPRPVSSIGIDSCGASRPRCASGRAPLRHARAGRADAGTGRDGPRLRVAPSLPGRIPRDHKRGSPSLRGGHGLTAHHARNLQAGLVDHAAPDRAPRSRLAPVSGHPRPKPASRTPLQWSRLAPISGHPRPKPASRTPLQWSRLAPV